MQYKDLGLKRLNQTVGFDWNGNKISIEKNLSSRDKYDIVMITLQRSLEENFYNPIKLDIYFHLNLVYSYTDIVFSDEDREDEIKLYDEMIESGFMDTFLQYIDIKEYKEMLEYIEQIADILTNYNSTTASIVKSIIDDLPAKAAAAQEIVDNFDPEKYSAVVNFAKQANNNIAIPYSK